MVRVIEKESLMPKSAAVVVFVLFACGIAFAQETTGAIGGRVVDAQGLPVPGAAVNVTGSRGVTNATTDADGRFALPFLTPGQYDVRVELQGFKPVERKSVTVGLGQTVSLPVTLEVGALSETVQVTASVPIIDAKTTTSGATMSSEFLQQIPLGRTLASTIYLAPGVSSSGTAGAANPSISGGSGLDNQYVIDGVNVTNQGYGALGSYSIIFGSLGNAMPFDFIDQVQVKTGGYEAEFGQATGGVVNVITKSGSNTIRGSAFGYLHPYGLERIPTQFQSINGSVQSEKTRTGDGGMEIGLPIVKNKLFFFGAFDPSRDVTAFRAPAGFPLESLGDVDRTRDTLTYSAKATWQPTSGQRVDASFFGDPSKGLNGPQRESALLVTDTSSYSSLIYGGHNQTVQYSGAFNSGWLLEGTFARALNRIEETPSVNTWRVTDQTLTPTVTTGGIGFYEAGNRSVNRQYAVKATRVFGAHNLKGGVGSIATTCDTAGINPSPGQRVHAAPGRPKPRIPSATGRYRDTILPDANFGQIFRVTRANFNSGRTTTPEVTAPSCLPPGLLEPLNRLMIVWSCRYEQEKSWRDIVSLHAPRTTGRPVSNSMLCDRRWQDGVCKNYGVNSTPDPFSLAADALSADDSATAPHCGAEALTQPIPDGVATIDPGTGAAIVNHFVLAGTSADADRPNAAVMHLDAQIGAPSRGGQSFDRRPRPHIRPRPHSRRRRELSDGGLRPGTARNVERRYR